jgi:DNA-binding response OmpR family regulator
MAENAYCRRCRAEIATANLLDIDPGVDRAHFALILTADRRRQLSPGQWRLFAELYGRHGRIVSTSELEAAAGIPESAIREEIHQLRGLLAQSRFELRTHRAHGYELVIREG